LATLPQFGVLLQILESCTFNLLQSPQLYIPPLFFESPCFLDFSLEPVRASGDRGTIQSADKLVKKVFDLLHFSDLPPQTVPPFMLDPRLTSYLEKPLVPDSQTTRLPVPGEHSLARCVV